MFTIEKLKSHYVELTMRLSVAEDIYKPVIQREIDTTIKRIQRLEVGEKSIEVSKSIIANTMTRLNKIQDKNKCARVRFLDWTASKILHYGTTWSASIQNISNKIDSPCVIKMGDPT